MIQHELRSDRAARTALMYIKHLTYAPTAEFWTDCDYLRKIHRQWRADWSITISRINEMGEVLGAGDKEKQSCYFILAPEIPLVKIGISLNPRNRLQAIQRHCPYKLVLLHSFTPPCARSTETDLHKRWIKHRSHHEWFEIKGEICIYLIPYLYDYDKEYNKDIFQKRQAPLGGSYFSEDDIKAICKACV